MRTSTGAIRAGELRYRVAIERKVQTQADSGDLTWTWEVFADQVPAKIVHLSAREFVAAQEIQAQTVATITIRWIEGITASMRVRDLADGTLYNIQGVLPDADTHRRSIVLPVAAGVNPGG